MQRDAYLISTIAGQAALSLTYKDNLILRHQNNVDVKTYLTNLLGENVAWNKRHQGWIVSSEESKQVISAIIFDRQPIVERNSMTGHPSSAQKPVSIVLYSSFGIITGEQYHEIITMRVIDGRIRSSIIEGRPCGVYEDSRQVGFWIFGADDLHLARTWMDTLK